MALVTNIRYASAIIYQPVPLHTDPVPPSINQYQPILFLLGTYRLLDSLPRVLLNIKMYECRRCVCVVACFLLFAQLCLSRPGLAVCCPPPFCITVFPSLPNLALRPACTLSTSSLATVRQGKDKDKYKYM